MMALNVARCSLAHAQVPAKRRKDSVHHVKPLRVEEFFESAVHTPLSKRFDKWESRIRLYVKDRGGKKAASAHSDFVMKILQGVQNPGDSCLSDAECLEVGALCFSGEARIQYLYRNNLLHGFAIMAEFRLVQ